MLAVQKITVHVPKGLLRQARDYTHEGVTETVRKGLELLAAARACEGLRKLRGKVRFSRPLKTLRYDRS